MPPLGFDRGPCPARARPVLCARCQHLEKEMATGTVKWFNPMKGYGFIQPSGGGGRDVFVRISAVERAGLRSLKPSSTRLRAIEVKSLLPTSGSNNRFANRTNRAYRLRLSDLWCVLLILTGLAAVLIGKRRRSRPNPPRVCRW